MRRALVNDIVHSFCYAVRKQDPMFKVVVLGQRLPEIGSASQKFSASEIAPFVCYALARTDNVNYIVAQRMVILAAVWLRAFSKEERAYAIELMEKYYECPGQAQCYAADQSVFQRDSGQRVPEVATLEECNVFLNADGTSCVPEEIPAHQEQSR